MTSRLIKSAFLFSVIALSLSIFIFGCGDVEENGGGTSSLKYIHVVPYSVTGLAVGSTESYNAIGIYSDGTSVKITSKCAWSVIGSIGSIAPHTYLSNEAIFTAEAVGTGEVRAVYGTKLGRGLVTVGASGEGTLISIEVTASPSFPVKAGNSTVCTAKGYFRSISGEVSSRDLTGVAWSTDNVLGTIESAGGKYYAETEGSGSYIYATSQEVQGTIEVRVAGRHYEIESNADAYVDRAYPTTNYGGADYDTHKVGIKTSTPVDTTYECQGLIKFDLSSIPSTVDASYVALKIYITDTTGDVMKSHYYVQRITSAWTETGVTFATLPNTNAYSKEAFDSSGTIADGSLTITNSMLSQIAQTWIKTPAQNYGIKLYKDSLGLSDGAILFNSRHVATEGNRPKLIVEY